MIMVYHILEPLGDFPGKKLDRELTEAFGCGPGAAMIVYGQHCDYIEIDDECWSKELVIKKLSRLNLTVLRVTEREPVTHVAII